jgi:DNA-binding helix-hairpin-helix protein with protein kinase domain
MIGTRLATASGGVTLGRTLATAGEGSVFELADRPAHVAKVFHGLSPLAAATSATRNPAERIRKVAVMIDHPPERRAQSDGHVVLTWPEELLFENGTPIGYVMPKVERAGSVELYEFAQTSFSPRSPAIAPEWALLFPWSYRVHTAFNLCRAVEVAHGTGAVIGDFNERNILITQSTRVTLVDCDSMQFEAPNGELFVCDVGRHEYLAPELSGHDLRRERRAPESDHFPLAIHIFRLLLDGMHPFAGGAWTGAGERKSATALARVGQYVGSAASPLTPGARDPDPAMLPPQIRSLFDRAFRFGGARPHARPSAREWRHELQRMLASLRTCRVDSRHQFPGHLTACPWCTLTARRR